MQWRIYSYNNFFILTQGPCLMSSPLDHCPHSSAGSWRNDMTLQIGTDTNGRNRCGKVGIIDRDHRSYPQASLDMVDEVRDGRRRCFPPQTRALLEPHTVSSSCIRKSWIIFSFSIVVQAHAVILLSTACELNSDATLVCPFLTWVEHVINRSTPSGPA